MNPLGAQMDTEAGLAGTVSPDEHRRLIETLCVCVFGQLRFNQSPVRREAMDFPRTTKSRSPVISPPGIEVSELSILPFPNIYRGYFPFSKVLFNQNLSRGTGGIDENGVNVPNGGADPSFDLQISPSVPRGKSAC
ncbi:hypothetical protein AGABI1DRAFT_130205 [Agaricus bisporus var. burnettii JB137-S8]|uniref:Uncharacterized protein n=1 Tax=Agaricus bisporus var. burnettii (strain JB137-S8 / ATCC MYA-4627 / FGSC 10392) TaxID=597362 RepID=K5WQ77_AGABU|nr:uncharacterized protein AGABI1DRAFT_130205 [Agaricus bisporus var. burnettii JB137-S8]EKM77506.1 hypothetical protein AGABI1DRAFT_130205 [Agaricus bisporus var. burnettii JB137-S8]